MASRGGILGNRISVFRGKGNDPARNAHSLRKRFTILVASILVAIVTAGLFFYLQLMTTDRVVEETRTSINRMHVFHTAYFIGLSIAHGRFDEQFTTIMNHELHEYMERAEASLTDSERALIDLLFASLADPARYRAGIEARLDELKFIHDKHDERAIRGFGQYSEWFRTLNLSLLLLLVLVSAVVIAPATLLVRDLMAGLRLLTRKIDTAESGGDPKHVVVGRMDEIGAIARAIDLMHEAAQAREMEAMISRQLLIDQQKMGDIVNLAGGIAHEVSNPLSTLAVGLDLHEELWRGHCQCSEDEKEKLRTNLHEMRAAIQRIETLVHDISSFPGEEEEKIETVDVNELVSRIVGMVRLDERTRRVDFVIKLSPDAPAVLAPRGRMALALYGVVATAAEQLHDRAGTATFETLPSPSADGVQLHVTIDNEDTGPPLPAKAADDGPEWGEEVPALRSARRILDKLGGALDVGSTPSGGTAFLARLPLSVRYASENPGRGAVRNAG